MKFGIVFCIWLSLNNFSFAKETRSTRLGTAINVARVVDIIKLQTSPKLQINLVVRDLGGSTDVSPTQNLFFTLYSKGEIFSTDATFDLGPIFVLKNARRLSYGIYQVHILAVDLKTSMPVEKTLIINVKKAISDIKNVKCEDFDCQASEEFESVISSQIL